MIRWFFENNSLLFLAPQKIPVNVSMTKLLYCSCQSFCPLVAHSLLRMIIKKHGGRQNICPLNYNVDGQLDWDAPRIEKEDRPTLLLVWWMMIITLTMCLKRYKPDLMTVTDPSGMSSLFYESPRRRLLTMKNEEGETINRIQCHINVFDVDKSSRSFFVYVYLTPLIYK